MTIDLNTIPANFILSSPESVRKKVLDRLMEYEQLHGVDLSKTHFLSYMIDVLSMLSSDNSNALSLAKRESYLATASLPSSIYNWASYLSYRKKLAIPAQVDVILSIPLDFEMDIDFEIPSFTEFGAGEIIYTNPEERYTFRYKRAENVFEVKSITPTVVRTIPVFYENNIAYVSLRLIQIQKIEEERFIPMEILPYQPHSIVLTHPYKLSSINLYMRQKVDDHEEKWEQTDNYFDMGLDEKKFAFQFDGTNKIRILFGNDIFGKQPTPGAMVRIELFTTKGIKGNIIPNSIDRMSRIMYISKLDGRAKIVSMSAMNPLASISGRDDETLQETKRNAIARFRARNRVVSELDYDDMVHIFDGLPYSHVKSILKRSDIKTNEIVLFVVLPKTFVTFEPQAFLAGVENVPVIQVIPIPTTTLTQVVESTTVSIKPYTTFVDVDGLEYVCPFGLLKESDTFVSYYYMVKSINSIPQVLVYDQIRYPLSFTNLSIVSSEDYSLVKFTLTYYNPNNVVNMSNIRANMFLKFRTDTKGPYSCVVDIPNNIITATLNIDDILAEPCIIEYHIIDSITGNTVINIKSNQFLRRSLRLFMYSSAVINGTDFTIYDIPCILKRYYLDLTSEELIQFEVDIIQKIVSGLNLSDYRMLNVSPNLKFAKTIGIVKNYELNHTTTGSVINILNAPPASPALGDRYIVGSNPMGAWASHKSKIAIFANPWIFLEAPPDTIISVTELGQRYTFSGNANRWLKPTFNIPFNILVYVYVNGMVENEFDVVDKIKKQLLYILSFYMGIDKEQHRSIMYKAIQDLGNFISHCEIKIPESNLIYNYDIDELTTKQLREYVPEYIYTDYEHISVRFIRL